MAKKVELGGDRMRIICHTDWAGAVKVVLLIQPSSSARLSEFSPYTPSCLFRSAAGCIQDYVETSVMLHYNHRRDNNVVFELTAYNY